MVSFTVLLGFLGAAPVGRWVPPCGPGTARGTTAVDLWTTPRPVDERGATARVPSADGRLLETWAGAMIGTERP
jgi:hypothetical protein